MTDVKLPSRAPQIVISPPRSVRSTPKRRLPPSPPSTRISSSRSSQRGAVRGSVRFPARISVCTAPGLSTTTTL